MDLKVFWTDTAIEKLEDIFDYYKNKASIQVARSIVGTIVDSTINLERQPKIGQVEELLINRTNEYRYLVSGNYKIIYWIDEPYIKIATVFDCRQNPIKLKTMSLAGRKAIEDHFDCSKLSAKMVDIYKTLQ